MREIEREKDEKDVTWKTEGFKRNCSGGRHKRKQPEAIY